MGKGQFHYPLPSDKNGGGGVGWRGGGGEIEFIYLFTVLQDALNSLVAPDAVRELDIAKGVVERVNDMVDRVACGGRGGLQPHDPTVELPRERPEHMNVKVVLGGSERHNRRKR